MIIEIKPDIFFSTDFRGLNTLIQTCFYKNRYPLIADISKVKETELYKRLDRDDRELFIQNFNSYILSQESSEKFDKQGIGSSDYIVTNHSKSDNEFNIHESIVFFSQKILLILENSLNDAQFIEAIVNHFDTLGKVRAGLKNDWISFENSGGCTNVKNFISGKLATYNYLPKDPHVYLRCFVLLDGDRPYPSLPINYKHSQLEGYLSGINIPCHITEKRNMENYMPDEVFTEFRTKENIEWTEARMYLSDVQKDFIDISKGFRKKGSNNVPKEARTDLDVEVQKLYIDVSIPNFDTLDKSFEIDSFKSNFPKKFTESHNVHRKSLLERTKHQTNPDELQMILDKIYSLI